MGHLNVECLDVDDFKNVKISFLVEKIFIFVSVTNTSQPMMQCCSAPLEFSLIVFQEPAGLKSNIKFGVCWLPSET